MLVKRGVHESCLPVSKQILIHTAPEMCPNTREDSPYTQCVGNLSYIQSLPWHQFLICFRLVPVDGNVPKIWPIVFSNQTNLVAQSSYCTHVRDVTNACFSFGCADTRDNHGKDTCVLWHERSISGSILEWQRQIMQACGMPFTSYVCRCDI